MNVSRDCGRSAWPAAHRQPRLLAIRRWSCETTPCFDVALQLLSQSAAPMLMPMLLLMLLLPCVLSRPPVGALRGVTEQAVAGALWAQFFQIQQTRCLALTPFFDVSCCSCASRSRGDLMQYFLISGSRPKSGSRGCFDLVHGFARRTHNSIQ